MSANGFPELEWIPIRPELASKEMQVLSRFVAWLAQLAPNDASATDEVAGKLSALQRMTRLHACSLVMRDLWRQGWSLRVSKDGAIAVRRPEPAHDPSEEKARVRAQLAVARDEQLSSIAAREFIRSMETRRSYRGRRVSIFSLMRDGSQLADELRTVQHVHDPNERAARLSQLISPYLEVVTSDAVCAFTGHRLLDIWRYFRHTWSSPHRSVPGRTMMVLVRDAAAECHPVIGIAALSSAAVQVRARDTWIGWMPDQIIENMQRDPSDADAAWLAQLVDSALAELFTDDLVEAGVLSTAELASPTNEAIARLRALARDQRLQHEQHAEAARDHKLEDDGQEGIDWMARARLPLFRSKRADVLATLLRARRALRSGSGDSLSATSLAALLSTEEGKQATRGILRRAKAERIGTAIADITVCGAVAPYNALLGGKLVAMLLASEELRHAYRERYRGMPSLIASSLAGRAITREPDLVLLCTTSLYGSGSSQYNRLHMAAEGAGGACQGEVRYRELGHTLGFGTSHLAADTLDALEDVAEEAARKDGRGQRVRSIFGEGVSPRLRKSREGLEVLGLAANERAKGTGVNRSDLLMHGSKRIVYGVPLAHNFREYLLGRTSSPDYILRGLEPRESTRRIVAWWMRRWLSARIARPSVLEEVARHRLTSPVRHGARVMVPKLPSAQLSMFED